MKPLYTLVFFLATSSLFAQSSLKIKGSDTMLPLVKTLAEVYKEVDATAVIKVDGGGSSTGIAAIKDGAVSVAMASRAIKESEKKYLQEHNMAFNEVEIAYDALSIIVHPGNPVSQLSKKQLEDIFTGKIANWSVLGGKDAPINIYTRDENSGTHEFMIKHVMNEHDFAGNAKVSASNAGIVQSVSQDKGGIGYIGLAYVEDVVKAISVSNSGTNYVAPTFKNAMDRKYPITRPLYLYYLKSASADAKKFVDFALKPLGQQMVTHKGYIPVSR